MEELCALLAPEFTAYFNGAALYLSLILLGAGIGFLTGFFGVGGGFLTVPLLNIVIGLPYEIAVGSDLSFIIGTSASGFLRQARLGKVEYKAVAGIAGGSILGAVCGDLVQNYLLFSVAHGSRESFDVIMDGLFALLLVVTVILILKGPRKTRGHQALLQRIRWGPAMRLDEPGLDRVNITGMLLVGFFIGLLTGIMGIGGGILMVPVLLILVGLPADKASGTSLGIIFLAALAAVVKKSLGTVPKISLPVTLSLLLASVIGVQLGIKAVQNYNTEKFRKYFSLVIVMAIVLIAVDIIFL